MKPILLFSVVLFSWGAPVVQPANQPTNEWEKPVDRAPSAVILDMNVQRLSGSAVRLSWHTEPEISGSGFEVQRRLGRDAVFSRIGFVASKTGGNAAIIDYSFTDKNLFTDTSYYRLKQIDGKAVFYTKNFSVPGLDLQKDKN